MRIGYGKGVCGTAWAEDRIIIVPYVDQIPGHIACSSLSKSEIVIPPFTRLQEKYAPNSTSTASGWTVLMKMTKTFWNVSAVSLSKLLHDKQTLGQGNRSEVTRQHAVTASNLLFFLSFIRSKNPIFAA